MIVIDVGCARYGGDYSIERLIEELKPDVLYGFDPSESAEIDRAEIGETRCKIERKAAWTYDGEIGFREDGLNSWVTDLKGAPQVPCIDLARFIRELPEDEIVLKVDAEGSEYSLLDHLMREKMDVRLSLAWVEFHSFGAADPATRRRAIERSIACPLEEWRW